MGWEAWYSLAVVILCITTLAVTRFTAHVVMVGSETLLLAGVRTATTVVHWAGEDSRKFNSRLSS